jgi:hypothetical protein
MVEPSDRDLLAALGVVVETKKARQRTPLEERIIAGFEDILRFRDEHGHAPEHGEDKDIFERRYAVRLDRLREQPECRELLRDIDSYGLLDQPAAISLPDAEALDDEALLAELGVEIGSEKDIRTLKHVPSRAEKRAAEEIAERTPCEDFQRFKPLFEEVKRELDDGIRETREFQRTAEIKQGEFFIVGGQVAYIANVGEEFVTQYNRTDRRLRVIYDNATESNVLARSLQKALYRDAAGRRITDPAAGPLFGGEAEETDLESGTIYVLRSQSDHPAIAPHRELIHKIGVTGGDVESRIAGAAQSSTFLFADVEVVASYKLFNINRAKLERIIHRVFANARLDASVADRFDRPVEAREWFLVPLGAINEAVDRIRDQSITGYTYDPAKASLVRLQGAAPE